MKHFLYIVLLFSGLSLGSNLFGQGEKMMNLSDFDQKDFHFGFTLGISSNDAFMNTNLVKVDSLVRLEMQRQPGFNLGIVSDLHMGPYFNLRFIPQLGFASRNLEYTFMMPDTSVSTEIKPVESTYLDFPLLLKYRSARLNNFAAYIITGAKYSLDLASQHDVDNTHVPRNEVVIKLKKHSYHWEVGFGVDFFLKYFKFSPELKVSIGLDNILIDDNTIYSDPIQRMNSKIFLVSFLFEG